MKLSTVPLQPIYLDRLAYVYVRQSTFLQVQEHPESTRRQYELTQVARQFGWPAERIRVIDSDLGHSASDLHARRSGFEQLLAEAVLGRVGAILSVEVSRLARQDSEWHRLVEVAALTEALLIDEQQVYNPRDPDDRLLLGLKGLLSSNEIRQMGFRMQENRLRKAQRGELRINLPVGLGYDHQQGIGLDPNQQVQAAVRLVLERFRLSGSICRVVRYFHEHELLFPKRKDGWEGELQWGRLTSQRVRAILTHPAYAGGYVYGRVAYRSSAKPREKIQQRSVRLPRQAWTVLQWNAFPSYLSREEYEANQAVLKHRPNPSQSKGLRQDGRALLSGIVLCGRCGRRMRVVYSGKHSQHLSYVCDQQQKQYAEPVCQRIAGNVLDQAVAERVLSALTPVQVELTLAVLDEIERQQTQLHQQWQLRLEAAQYACRLAQRRYEQVDPENRLVARTLEQEWEARLQEKAEWEANYVRLEEQTPLKLDEAQRQQLAHLVEDLPRVWQADTTTWAERKELLHLLVADVTLLQQADQVQVQIRWHTNEIEALPVPLAVRGAPTTPAAVVERLRLLSLRHSDPEIAEWLNQEGFHTAQGKAFTAKRVQGLRRRYHIDRRSSNLAICL